MFRKSKSEANDHPLTFMYLLHLQEEQIDPQNTSGLGDTSWISVSSYKAVRASQAEDYSKDASYLRLSLGEFFGQRSEALGCLGGDSDVKRVCNCFLISSGCKLCTFNKSALVSTMHL